MSTVKANTFQDATGGSNAVFSGVASPPNGMGFRNRIINGDMRIDQRNAGASVATSALQSTTYFLDRWNYYVDSASKLTLQQSTTAPAGFTNSMLVTVASTHTTAGQSLMVRQFIEGLNVADLGWGTANAQSVTLSFKARSSVTGTFAGFVQNSASNRSYVFTFTINSANTFEDKTITIPGDTTGTWLTTNGIGLSVGFQFGPGFNPQTAGSWVATNAQTATGATNLAATNGATFYITGVQLEAGTVASPFERRDYGRELMMCQRYAYVNGQNAYSIFGNGFAFNTTGVTCITYLPVEMRAIPSLSTSGSLRLVDGISAFSVTSVAVNNSNSSTKIVVTEPNVASGLTQFRPYALSANNDANARFVLSSEL